MIHRDICTMHIEAKRALDIPYLQEQPTVGYLDG